ncbi:solute carrier organic anion transporter family member 74D-like [Arctopsyche grandis]|uniref:solute carrier organic anion transporter family member 74D-like n=1 Tax=Arctopsyche grandis TaxID=121162 RepID=UPI00406D690E
MSTKVQNRNEEEQEDDLKVEFEEFYKKMPLTEETTCGFWIFKGPRLQALANKKFLVFLYGLTGCFFSSSFAYFNGTITTMEKRFKIPSKVTGIILIGNDITKLLFSVILNYYASRGHRPRWTAVGLYLMSLFCFMNALPHLLYGSGIDALKLTREYGHDFNISKSNTSSDQQIDNLCSYKEHAECDIEEGSMMPPIILFVAQLIGGVGTSLYHSLTFAYMDDNIKKTKSPIILSFTHFMRMFGPALGYGIVSICLKLYIDPHLTPTIDNSDPRWLGAWWLGWLLLGTTLIAFASAVAMLPKVLPRAAARKELLRKKSKLIQEEVETTSLKDMAQAVKRLLHNKVYLYTKLSSIFCIFGYNPFWVYLPKFIEIQYNKSASAASLITGTTGLIFVGIGILLGGLGVQKLKPKARHVSIWNTIIDVIFTLGILSYAFLGCPAVDNQITTFDDGELKTNLSCNSDCECDYVKFSPVCAIGQVQTYITACHAGCTQQNTLENGTTIFRNCSCILPSNNVSLSIDDDFDSNLFGSAISGPCETDCQFQFYFFIAIKCITKMFGAMGRITFFLMALRCVEERDKSLSIALSMGAVALFALIPSPIFFGYIIDSTCLIWGKTCNGTGNCWLFNASLLRNRLSLISSLFVFIGVCFDLLVWKHIKDINMFDESTSLKSKEDNLQPKVEKRL